MRRSRPPSGVPLPQDNPRRDRLLAALAPALALLLVGLGPLRVAGIDVADDVDERLFHHPTAARFAASLPAVDLSDYPSATTPLHHLYLAVVARLLSPDLVVLRGANLLVALVGVVLVGALLARRARPLAAALLAAPLALSPYWVGPAVRLSTDDAALVWVFGCLAALELAGGRPERRVRWLLAAGLAATGAVLTRQVHLWLAGLLGLAAVLPGLLPPPAPGRRERLAALGAAALPALALAPFVALWRGLAPPGLARAHETLFNPDAVVMALGVLGMLGAFFLPMLLGPLRAPEGRRRAWTGLGLAAAAGLALLALSPLAWVDDANRWGGALWALSARFPVLAGSSLPFWGFVPLGLGLAWLVAAEERRRGGWLLSAALPLFLLANAANARAYQKYYEPFLLFWLAWAASRAEGAPRWAVAGPALLAAGFLAVDLVRFY